MRPPFYFELVNLDTYFIGNYLGRVSDVLYFCTVFEMIYLFIRQPASKNFFFFFFFIVCA